MNHEHEKEKNIDIQKLQGELQELKTKLRMTKSDRDIISKYTSQLNRDMTTLQEKHNEMVKERDYYAAQLRDVKTNYISEIHRLEREIKRLREEYIKENERYDELKQEYDEVKIELRNVTFEYDVLQVDFHNERETHRELQKRSQELRRKYRNIQIDLNEADKTNTKRHNRLIEQVEALEKDKKLLQLQVDGYENDLEELDMLCFVCRVGVKMVKCEQCVEMFCQSCIDNMESCPMCRTEFSFKNVEII
jgi:chromosome segregation ATPase